jgi:hypothetical protein
MSQFTDQAYKLAVEKLLKNASQKGVMASSSLSDGDKPAYPDLYPRDMGVCVIGMLQDDNQELLDLAKLSVESLIVAQSEKGQFPQCFRLAENRAEWWHAGTIDGTLWWSIALLEYVKKTGNRGFLDYLKPNLEKAFTWLTYQDTITVIFVLIRTCCLFCLIMRATNLLRIFPNIQALYANSRKN